MKAGDIYWASSPFTDEIGEKPRPIFLLSVPDERVSRDVIAIPITGSSLKNELLEFELSDEMIEGVFMKKSYLKFTGVFSIERKRIQEKLTTVKPLFFEKIKEAFIKMLKS
jgi:mRNA-degrading endonuclease toxin of MazEF toxin-antitoxin module